MTEKAWYCMEASGEGGGWGKTRDNVAETMNAALTAVAFAVRRTDPTANITGPFY